MGSGIGEHFMLPYNFKVWATPPELMNYVWIGERVSVVDVDQILRNVILGEDLPTHAAAMGNLIKDRLGRLPHVQEVRGMGLLLGLRLDVPAKAVQAGALERGIILGTSADPNVLRVMPPMVVTEQDIEHLASMLDILLSEM